MSSKVGGAGEFGGSGYYSGENIVSTSIESKTPIIFVAMNYRMNVSSFLNLGIWSEIDSWLLAAKAFGALGGKEVRAEGVTNLGLKDQRLALKWIQVKFLKRSVLSNEEIGFKRSLVFHDFFRDTSAISAVTHPKLL